VSEAMAMDSHESCGTGKRHNAKPAQRQADCIDGACPSRQRTSAAAAYTDDYP
jgi:hypothetical protein